MILRAAILIGASTVPGLTALAEEDDTSKASQSAPTLEWLRDRIIVQGISPRLVKIERLAGKQTPEGQKAAPTKARRLVFWTKTRRLTQTIVIAVVAN